MSTATSAAEFRKKAKQGIPLELPSGNTCLVRPRPGIDAFMQKGIIPNALMPIVQKALADGSKEFAFSDLKGKDGELDPNLLGDMLDSMNKAMCFVVVSPTVKMMPLLSEKEKERLESLGLTVSVEVGEVMPDELRDIDADGDQLEVDWLYADEVDFDDKNFIYGWSMGGTTDLEQFRAEQTSNVESVSNG